MNLRPLVFVALLGSTAAAWGQGAGARVATTTTSIATPTTASSSSSMSTSLAEAFAQLLENSIPLEYERKKDWGKRKRITSGLNFDDFDIKRRHREVKHGVWKHYRVSLRNPEEKLRVEVTDLTLLEGSQFGFTVHMSADLDLWARAKIYQYGVHLGSYETTGNTTMKLAFRSTVGVELEHEGMLPAVRIDPQVTHARFDLVNFRIERISNAHGPLVKELSKTIEKTIESELSGPQLVKKINRSIDKKRDKLVFSPSQLLGSAWWPLAELPDVAPVVRR